MKTAQALATLEELGSSQWGLTTAASEPADARQQRFRHPADAIAANPPGAAYLAEAQEWESDAWK